MQHISKDAPYHVTTEGYDEFNSQCTSTEDCKCSKAVGGQADLEKSLQISWEEGGVKTKRANENWDQNIVQRESFGKWIGYVETEMCGNWREHRNVSFTMPWKILKSS